MSNGVYVSFGLTSTHGAGAQWTFTANANAAPTFVSIFNAIPEGSTLSIPPSTYLFDSIVDISSKKNLVVEAYGATFKAMAYKAPPNSNANAYNLFRIKRATLTTDTSLIWRGGTFDGNRFYQLSQVCTVDPENLIATTKTNSKPTIAGSTGLLTAYLIHNVVFEDIKVQYNAGEGVVAYTCDNVTFRNCVGENGLALSQNNTASILNTPVAGPITLGGGALASDITVIGSSPVVGSKTYNISIVSNGTPDTFHWTDGTNSGSALITGKPQLLSDSVYIKFTATSGNNTSHTWSFTYSDSHGDQNTYFKVRAENNACQAKWENIYCTGGSIGVHFSSDHAYIGTSAHFDNIYVVNPAQDAVHVEHAAHVTMTNIYCQGDLIVKPLAIDLRIDQNNPVFYRPDIHIGGETRTANLSKLYIRNSKIDFGTASELCAATVSDFYILQEALSSNFTYAIDNAGTVRDGVIEGVYSANAINASNIVENVTINGFGTVIPKTNWMPATLYNPYDIVFNSGNAYQTTSGGTSGYSGGPSGLTPGTDGSVAWTYLNTAANSLTYTHWQPQTDYILGDIVFNFNKVYIVTAAGRSGTNGGPTEKGYRDDNTVVWGFVDYISSYLSGKSWQPACTYAAGDIVYNGAYIFKASNSATSASSGAGPTLPLATDGGITWTYLGKFSQCTGIGAGAVRNCQLNYLASIGTINGDGIFYDNEIVNCRTGVLFSNVSNARVRGNSFDTIGLYAINALDTTSSTPVLWTPGTTYAAGAAVYNHNAVYTTAAGGVSASANGPAGTGASITDNTVSWAYAGESMRRLYVEDNVFKNIAINATAANDDNIIGSNDSDGVLTNYVSVTGNEFVRQNPNATTSILYSNSRKLAGIYIDKNISPQVQFTVSTTSFAGREYYFVNLGEEYQWAKPYQLNYTLGGSQRAITQWVDFNSQLRLKTGVAGASSLPTGDFDGIPVTEVYDADTSIPTSGYYPLGAIRKNSAPAVGSAWGWVQLTPGKVICLPSRYWVFNTVYTLGTIVYNGLHAYEATTPGRSDPSSSSTGPANTTLPITGDSGTVVWKYIGDISPVACGTPWHASTPYTGGAIVTNANNVYQVINTGTSGSTGPSTTAASITDGGVIWKFIGPLAVFKPVSFIGTPVGVTFS